MIFIPWQACHANTQKTSVKLRSPAKGDKLLVSYIHKNPDDQLKGAFVRVFQGRFQPKIGQEKWTEPIRFIQVFSTTCSREHLAYSLEVLFFCKSDGCVFHFWF